MDWEYAFRLFVITSVGTFLVMGALTVIISIMSNMLSKFQKSNKN